MARLLSNPAMRLRRKYSEQRGSMLVYTTVVFSAMFVCGGAAIDFARHEHMRSEMQYNLDRAVLAAASLKQTLEPVDVVQSYMGSVRTLSDFTVEVDSDIGLNYRSVSATATGALDTWFLHVAGVPELSVGAASAAEERVPNLEIALVLDVSGSMNSNSKLSNLKTAAKEFVTTMIESGEEGSVAISIVPFNHSVAPSDALFEALTVDETHNYSTCLDFEDADFSSVSIDPTTEQTQSVYTSLYGGFESLNSTYRTCYSDADRKILAYSSDETDLHDAIDDLNADGNTAGHLGVKWGAALLDPAFQPVVSALVSSGDVDADLDDLPVDYSDVQTLKVIVFMGDGANTTEWRFASDSDFRGAASNLYEVTYAQEEFSHAYYIYNHSYTYYGAQYEYLCNYRRYECVYDPTGSTETAYYLHKTSNDTYFEVDGSNSGSYISASAFANLPSTLTGYQSQRQLNWEEAWGMMSLDYYDDVTRDDDPFDEAVYSAARVGSEADTVMAANCNAAKNAGIIVYSIGFETDSTTSGKLSDCASSAGHYYDAQGAQISSVFGAIAASIQKLKLTQ